MIVVVDYGTGNLGSILNMLRKVGAQAVASADPEVIEGADRLVLPGVGAFDNGVRNLRERGLVEVLNHKVVERGTPILGVCLGMQLLTQGSEEGQLPGFGWVDAEVRRFAFSGAQTHLKVPHMGWNTTTLLHPHSLFAGLEADARFYFVHSYYVACRNPETALAETWYGEAFTSSVASGNVLGVQFHPEKSHRFGMQLFRNFVALNAAELAGGYESGAGAAAVGTCLT